MTRTRINTEAELRMQMAMKLGPQTYDDLMLVTGLTKNSVARWIKNLRSLKPRPIHIAAFRADSRGRLFIPAYAWGTKDDVKRPGREPSAAARRMREMRARKKGEPT